MPALYDLRMTNSEERGTRYASYLLRLRLMWNDNDPVWIASAENTATGSYRSFPNVGALAAFLLAEFGGRESVVKGGSQSKGEDKQPHECE